VRSKLVVLGDLTVRPSDVGGRLASVESGQRGLLTAFGEHEQQDERRFTETAARFEAGYQGIRTELALLSRAITEAISGDSKTEGLRERVRTIEAQHLTRENDMRWMKRMLWTTVAGLAASVTAGIVLFLATKTGTMR